MLVRILIPIIKVDDICQLLLQELKCKNLKEMIKRSKLAFFRRSKLFAHLIRRSKLAFFKVSKLLLNLFWSFYLLVLFLEIRSHDPHKNLIFVQLIPIQCFFLTKCISLQYCLSKGGKLVEPITPSDISSITQYIIHNNCISCYYWLGITDIYSEGNFTFASTGCRATVFNWRSGQNF